MMFISFTKENEMFIRPLESAVTTKAAENIKNMKFISAYEIVPQPVMKPIQVVSDRFFAAEKEIKDAPKSVLDSITRIFW